ncbi:MULTISPECIES: ATP-binding cassette domain-containing protein [Bacillus]|uniref:ABC transporter ATP-binding protein n=1 Tax=Bacillus TaxID=1386 RepID=UPI00025B1AA4|nr:MULTISPECIES: ATP-binding cassette domain-containing protein [Bacillus]EIF12237.1 Methionine import ATP-binding protein metN [Bacillus sp. 5B6]MEC0954368.1 ATP-binding cassette domain-containing protein [Bacillus velezensis]MED3704133.1 ATP-binding cassette domain-containing protein [Bacillus velezensis]QGI74940.1 ATP-binding cassette domain-containing protein [Bacillus velezensis]QNE08894.1 ABC transporter ATP-binding protein [Bacillus velezensis]
MGEEQDIITVTDLRKKYGSFEAVKGVSFSVKRGELFAFLGTNGAGKSTTIDILCTLIKKTSGKVVIDGYTLGEGKENNHIRKKIGVVFQESILDERLTVYENIMNRGQYYHLSKAQVQENYQFVTDYLKLDDIKEKKYSDLSGGQRRRADIARAIIHKPTILFLDEPTTGLDPQTRVFVWNAIKRLQEETNMTIFLTTHYMEEAAVADNVVVIKEGRLIAEGTPSQLKDQYAFDSLHMMFKQGVDPAAWFENKQLDFTVKNSIYSLRVESTLQAFDILKGLEGKIESFEVIKGNMDDVFIHIIEEQGSSLPVKGSIA